MSKKILSLVCAFVMLSMLALPLAAFANVHHGYVKTGNGGSLNVRSATQTHANNVVAKLEYGTQVVILEYAHNNTWALVEFDTASGTKRGYVMTRYLSNTQPDPFVRKSSSAAQSAASGDVTLDSLHFGSFEHVTPYTVSVRPSTPGGFVNLRWAPTTKVAVMERCYDGYQLTVIAQSGHWAQVMDPATGYVGYMMRKFMTVVNPNVPLGQGASVQ